MKKEADPPKHRVLIVPLLKRPMQRFVLPNWTAITIGSRIFAWRALDTVELAHELTHVKQWKHYGLSFIVRYFMESRRAASGGGDRYLDNKFEKEAAEAGEKARKQESS